MLSFLQAQQLSGLGLPQKLHAPDLCIWPQHGKLALAVQVQGMAGLYSAYVYYIAYSVFWQDSKVCSGKMSNGNIGPPKDEVDYSANWKKLQAVSFKAVYNTLFKHEIDFFP